MTRATTIERREVRIRANGAGVELDATLALPRPRVLGLVICADGSGGSRLSPRNRLVAERFNEAGLATLLSDLLTTEEGAYDEVTLRLRFDVELLARRLRAAIDWAHDGPMTRRLDVGLYGASTGAAAALMVAADRRARVRAVVTRSGRPDLAGEALAHVQAPTLLIVGALDPEVLDLNREAARHVPARPLELLIVDGANHQFDEPGKLEEAAAAAAGWFGIHLGRVDQVEA